MFRGMVLFMVVVLGLQFGVVFHAHASETISIGVTIPPQKYFLEQIGGSRVKVVTLIPQGFDPHVYEPKPDDIKAFKEAKAYFSIGVLEVELVWLERIRKLFPEVKIFSTVDGISLKGGDHHHGEYKHHLKHLPSGFDPHVWTSPPLVMIQSRNILRHLMSIDPQGREVYEANYKSWMMRLVELDLYLQKLFEPLKGRKFLIYHPAWGYFAEAYGIEQIPVEREGKAPGPSELKKIRELVESNRVKILFTTTATTPTGAGNIAQSLKLDVKVADPLVYEWEKNLRMVGEILAESLK